MSAAIGLVATALMIFVLIIAIGSLLIVGTMPFAKFFSNRRAQRDDDDTPVAD